jgi:hypothetical protein
MWRGGGEFRVEGSDGNDKLVVDPNYRSISHVLTLRDRHAPRRRTIANCDPPGEHEYFPFFIAHRYRIQLQGLVIG